MIPRPNGLTAIRGIPASGPNVGPPPARRTRADLVALSRPLLGSRGTAVVPRISLLPAFREAELILARQGRHVGSRPVRVPQDAFVPIQPRLLPAPSAPRLMLDPPKPVPSANDNASPEPAQTGRPLLREVLFLLMLAATLAGTFWIGRLNAAQNIIVVPGPSSARSVIT